MPLYEFECRACGQESEILARSSNWQGTKCPKCGSTKLAKKLSVFAGKVAAGDGASAPAMPPCGMNPKKCCACGPHHRH